jgi:hypothetical protein
MSDKDPYGYEKENSEIFREKLGAKMIVEKGKGHMGDDLNIRELPIILEELLNLMENK